LVPQTISMVVSIVILAYILWNQMRVRVLRAKMTLPVVLIVLGAGNLSSLGGAHPLSGAAVALLILSLLGDAVGIGALRAYTVRLWRDGAQIMRQGTWVTMLLWLLGISIHVLLDAASGAGSASYLLYLGLTLGTQRLVLQSRTARLAE